MLPRWERRRLSWLQQMQEVSTIHDATQSWPSSRAYTHHSLLQLDRLGQRVDVDVSDDDFLPVNTQLCKTPPLWRWLAVDIDIGPGVLHLERPRGFDRLFLGARKTRRTSRTTSRTSRTRWEEVGYDLGRGSVSSRRWSRHFLLLRCLFLECRLRRREGEVGGTRTFGAPILVLLFLRRTGRELRDVSQVSALQAHSTLFSAHPRTHPSWLNVLKRIADLEVLFPSARGRGATMSEAAQRQWCDA